MKTITIDMINKFEMVNMDWMGYILINDEEFDFHHIKKKCDGGQLIISNGAILIRGVSHPYIHIIESRDLDRFIYLNQVLKCINIQGHMPTEKQLCLIDSVLTSFEKEYSSARSSSGKILIKEQYTRRLKR